MYCTSCGKEIEDGARFCNHCGAQVELDTSNTSVTTNMPVAPGVHADVSNAATQVMFGVEPGSSNTQVNTQGMPTAPAQKQPLSRNAKIGIGIGAGLLVVAVIVVAVLAATGFFNQLQPESRDNATSTKTTIIDKTSPEDAQSSSGSSASSNSRDTDTKANRDSSSDTFTSSSIEGYTTYTNGRFGFSVAYPSEFLLSEQSDNGSGASFVNDSTEDISINTWGQNNTNGETAQSALSRLEDSIGIEGYTAVGDNWFVYSYEINGEVVYLKEYVGAGSIVGMSITYPRSMSSEGDRMVEIMEPTFEPGDISSTH